MKKSTWNAIVVGLMVIVMLSVVFIGILLGFFVGRGSVPQAEKYLWGLHRHDWADLHLIFSLILVGLVVLHFILHVGWVRAISKRFLRLHWLVSLLILLVIAAGIVYGSIAWKRARPGDWERQEPRREEGRGRGRLPGEERGFGGGQGRGLGRGRGGQR
jgi:hypothetical protein